MEFSSEKDGNVDGNGGVNSKNHVMNYLIIHYTKEELSTKNELELFDLYTRHLILQGFREKKRKVKELENLSTQELKKMYKKYAQDGNQKDLINCMLFDMLME